MIMKENIIIIALLISLLGAAGAQEIHKLERYIITIDGNTREKSLIREMDLKEGMEFADRASLEKAVLRQQQDLVNLRVFNEISMTLSEGEPQGETTVYSVQVHAEDSWNIYPIPYPKYNSNDGVRLGLKLFYNNAFGTLNDLYLGTNITFKYDNNDQSWDNTSWTFNPQLNNVKIGNLEYDFGFMQQKSYAEKKEDDVYLERYNYYNTSADVRTTMNFGADNKFYYQVKPGIGINYSYSGDGIGDNEEPFYLSFSHGGGYSKVDWRANFREGFSASVGNSIRYVNKSVTKNQVKVFIDGQSSFYKIINPRMNYMTRASGTVSFNDEMNGLGINLRGVEDSTMFGLAGLFLNNDVTFSVIQWEGVGEAQFQPFFDIGLSRREGYTVDWNQDLRYGTGADFILYLDKLKGLHARASVGVDLSSDLPFSDFGKYELEITSSLHY
ncbi:hypothetical protein [Oceanispirochaeta sp.]|jgi:hypothetical protein|uniref:hypothetical protein n=1 Tax=Oceanispirochaeta sp. TaxID=2035350 RepID=UPI002609BBE1|nr:hypothetical protein [Oceanispirochaeta sp.]MDA3956388.1 hypothetical protein [Oceanispirochaeta sp.]